MRSAWMFVLVATGCGDDVQTITPTVDAAPPAAPVVLASDQIAPTNLTVDGTNVYWASEPDGTTAKEIWTVSKEPGQVARRLTTTNVCTSGLAIDRLVTDAQHVYWSNRCRIARVDKDLGGTAEECTGAEGALDLAMSGTDLYALTVGGSLAVATKQAFAFTDRVSGLTSPISLARVGTTLYFATLSPDAAGQIYSMTTAGSTAVPIAPAPWTFHLAADDDAVYWIQGNDLSTQDDDAIMKWTATTDQVETLVPGPINGGHNLVSDGANLYWVVGGSIMRVRKDGGTPARVVKETGVINGLAVDATGFYYSNFTDGTINKLAR